MNEHTIVDTDQAVAVQRRQTVFSGAIWEVRRDTFVMDATDHALTREYIAHPGAVAIVALDEQQRVAMIRQYRHPVGQACWEIPAGLLDVAGEDALSSAQRELAEEADLEAQHWSVLIDHYPSSGSSSELIRIYLAQGITSIPAAQRHQRVAEEASLHLRWVPLTEAVEAIMAGAVKNVNAVAGLLATHLVVRDGYPTRSLDGVN